MRRETPAASADIEMSAGEAQGYLSSAALPAAAHPGVFLAQLDLARLPPLEARAVAPPQRSPTL